MCCMGPFCNQRGKMPGDCDVWKRTPAHRGLLLQPAYRAMHKAVGLQWGWEQKMALRYLQAPSTLLCCLGHATQQGPLYWKVLVADRDAIWSFWQVLKGDLKSWSRDCCVLQITVLFLRRKFLACPV